VSTEHAAFGDLLRRADAEEVAGAGSVQLLRSGPLRARRSHEAVHLRELASHARRTALEPWHADVMAIAPTHAGGVAWNPIAGSARMVRR